MSEKSEVDLADVAGQAVLAFVGDLIDTDTARAIANAVCLAVERAAPTQSATCPDCDADLIASHDEETP